MPLLHIGRYGVSRRVAAVLALWDQSDQGELAAARLASKRSLNTRPSNSPRVPERPTTAC